MYYKIKYLPRREWVRRKSAHEVRIENLTGNYLEQRRRRIKHPVLDFLFEYYSFRPSRMKQWSPGHSVVLEDAGPDFPIEHKAFTGERIILSGAHVTAKCPGRMIDPALFPIKRQSTLQFIEALLKATVNRPPRFGCFGLHEWAMVYRSGQRRHPDWPLRMDQHEIDRFVESRNIACSHFDAFRFFSEPAQPMNKLQPSRETMVLNEQPGCLHTNMDLYKWAYKLFPFTGSDIIADAFELALFTREVDMKASPYDLKKLGYEPIAVETDTGRRQYADLQKKIHEYSIPIRRALLESVSALNKAVTRSGSLMQDRPMIPEF
jgi:hypothetical protein